ncbi:hypothetical protein D9758_008805 [Tetrapyrgos nigripes]|uniref:3-phytase n=1 Tax=Tetrapyrgos nigripes TaxID=182062 RepID=A0A8H5FY05_9AGAR|nr:hypothetical protein D9758_008805 [Tetrapyrgos nigripes]
MIENQQLSFSEANCMACFEGTNEKQRSTGRRVCVALKYLLCLTLVTLLWTGYGRALGIGLKNSLELGVSGEVTTGDRHKTFVTQRSWAQYSPYFPVEEYKPPPSGCIVDQVNILQRHGARFPTSGASSNIISAINKLKAVQNSFSDPNMLFIRSYKYDLGQNDLVELGAKQSSDSGTEVFNRYSHLVSRRNLPFVRSDSSERVVLSALNWTEGFSIASNFVYQPPLSVMIPQDSNNTLDDHMCPAAGKPDEEDYVWLSKFALEIQRRLEVAAPGSNLNLYEVYALGTLCAFDSVAHSATSPIILSPWCSLFNQTDFENLEYAGDLDKYYGTGYGQPLGAVQGVGYTNELLARLMDQPVRDHTQTNSTLDRNEETFPLGRGIYIDFSHDNQMIAIYSAIGLFPQPVPLDTTPDQNIPDPKRTWKVGEMVVGSAFESSILEEEKRFTTKIREDFGK